MDDNLIRIVSIELVVFGFKWIVSLLRSARVGMIKTMTLTGTFSAADTGTRSLSSFANTCKRSSLATAAFRGC